MEAFGYMGFVFALIAFTSVSSLKNRVAKLERIINESKVKVDNSSLKDQLYKNIGSKCKLSFYDSEMLAYLLNKEFVIMDVDSNWLLVKELKKDEEKLVSLSSIKGVEFI